MFIGHFAPAFIAAAVSPARPRLGLYFLAAQLVDWAFFVFVLIGVEDMRIVPGITAMNPMDLHQMPYTHSLLGSAGFALAFALFVLLVTKDRVVSLLAGAVVLSHWVLDLLVHRPDLTLAGDPPKFGLGLWNVPLVEMPLELALTFGAMAFFITRTRGYVLPALVLAVLLLALQAINWFGPEPEAVTAGLSYTAFFAFGLLTLAASWLGQKRRVKPQDGGLALKRGAV
ncbi:hypothetical protein [Alteriqipengyuania lutimaris]|uniref:Metal-dependent hydrolase n=1 Tax=Alteriqipengyuania lutimaris TaxID=1538146 RepID=A0A395LTT9_9SPHN|nr:hypothetical protein [Alteriqipengyuania lutimaris]MBB3033004.1 hypothetical protein [Alteriqipengyuania lutimaris]RDS77920.1 hypothetical protein DL238_10140 [Alteriqipengyuania lutimaris]